MVHIIDIRDEPARLGPAVTLFDALFLSQFKKYQIEILNIMWLPVMK